MKKSVWALFVLFALPLCAQPRPGTEGGEVTLPLADYQKLIDSLTPPEPPPAPEPSLSAARLDIAVGEETARAEMHFSARSEKVERSELALGADWPAESVAVTPPTAILARREGRLRLELPGAGSWQVLVRSTFPVASSGETESVEVPLPLFSAVAGTVSAAGSGTDIQVHGAMVTGRRSSGNIASLSYASQGEKLVIVLRRAGGKRKGQLKLSHVAITAEERVEEGYLRSTGTYQALLESGSLEGLDFTYPRDCEVLFARGEKVSRYDAKDGKLRVTFASPATPESPGLRVEIGLSRKISEGRLTAPAPTASGPVTYVLAFFPSESVDLSLAESGSFEDAPPGSPEVPRFGEVAEEILIARGDRSPEFPTYLVEKRKEGKVLVVTIPEARFLTLADEKGNLLTEATYLVQTRSRASLKLQLPTDAKFWEADAAGAPLAVRVDPDGRLILPLLSAAARNRVRVVYATASASWQTKQKLEASLPAVSAPISRATWSLLLPSAWKVELARGSAWAEAGVPAPLAAEEAAEGAGSAEAGFLAAARGDRASLRKGSRGILVGLPADPARTFRASLIEGAPPPLVLEMKRERHSEEWQ
jgi:hypothetical protein